MSQCEREGHHENENERGHRADCGHKERPALAQLPESTCGVPDWMRDASRRKSTTAYTSEDDPVFESLGRERRTSHETSRPATAVPSAKPAGEPMNWITSRPRFFDLSASASSGLGRGVAGIEGTTIVSFSPRAAALPR